MGGKGRKRVTAELAPAVALRAAVPLFVICACASWAFTPTGLAADDRRAFAESEAFAVPDMEDFRAENRSALTVELIRLFEVGTEKGTVAGPGTDAREGENYSYTEGYGSVGPRRLSAFFLEGFQGGPFACVGSYREDRTGSEDGAYEIVRRDGGASVMLSDPAGSVVILSGDYSGKEEETIVFGSQAAPAIKLSSLRFIASYRSHFLGASKLSTEVSDTYSVQRDYGPALHDNLISASSDYTFQWLGDNSLRGSLSVKQGSIGVSGGESAGVLFGRIIGENDFCVSDKVRFAAGIGGFMLRRDATTARVYPRSSLHVGLSRNVGLYVKYGPYMDVPEFRDLYLDTDYSVARVYIPFADVYADFETGAVNNVGDRVRLTATFFARKWRYDYARADLDGDTAVEYYDIGKYAERGFTVNMSYSLHPVIVLNYGFQYRDTKPVEVPGGHIPYRPSDVLTAGLFIGRRFEHNLTVEVKRVGERFGDAGGAVILPPYFNTDATARIRVARFLVFVLEGRNLGDNAYDVVDGVLAPGRTVAVGVKFMI